ncbi:hypothetical protein [Legionella rowbothamii]|jgi:DNA-binding MarR family transcriptional regulator|uniref:hypothetical protein n=1 Tax=Legionella rowbothamii TaxID=96229 RepID=UPI001055062B|nr:hypothetical protein [Legionella rowbothamii]
MPTIDQLAEKSKKKFVKSDYRPWNYMDEVEKESNSIQLEIKEGSYGDEAIIKNKEGSPITHNKTKTVKRNNTAKLENAGPLKDETTLDAIFRLTGHQRKIFMFIVERCASRGMLTTGVIKGEVLSEITGTSSQMVKTSIQRLVSKDLIQRERGKTGRGGFYIFSLTELIRNAAIEYKRMVGNEDLMDINRISIGNHMGIEKAVNNKHDNKTHLPEEWKKINIYPLEDIGFNQNHLRDILETELADPQMVQESILHFAYGLEHEPAKYKHYDDLLNLLIGRLRKGKPWFEKNYRSPQEIAQALLIEAKKNELERKKKLEDDAFKIALAEWQETLNQNEITEITAKKGSSDITPQTTKLSIYFRENIWPEKKILYFISEG